MRRVQVFGSALALLSAGPLTPALEPTQPQWDAAAQVELEALVTSEMTRTKAPGVALAIVIGDRVVLARGYGVASTETQVPVTEDTLLHNGSVTKTFTAAAVLTAMAEGSPFTLQAPVGALVSGLTPCLQPITIGQLLSHTGGLIDEPDEFGPQGEDGLATYPRTWTSEYCLLAPGRAFSYSNSGYALAGLALQEHEKRPFADIIRARVLAPLGMSRTTFRPTEAMTYPVAPGHRAADGRPQVVRPLPNDARLWPAGTLYSSASEMARLMLALVNEGRVDGRQAVAAPVVRTMMTPQASRPTVGGDYGFGLELDTFQGHRRAGHGGAMTGSAAQLQVLPDARLAVVVLANGDGALLGRVAERALQLAAGNGAGAGAHPPDVPGSGQAAQAVAVPPDRVAGYVGTYTNPRRFTVEVVQQGTQLVLRRFGREFAMRAVAVDRFVVERPGGGTETIAFGLGRDGRAEYLQMNVWALAARDGSPRGHVAAVSPGAAADVVRQFLKRRRIPGAAVAVVHRGRVVHAAGYGTANLELDVPVTEATLFEIGSITKQFTAEAVVLLAEAGRLNLDDLLSAHLQGLPPSWNAITLRHLLTHTSGIADWEALGTLSYRREYTPAEFVALVATTPLAFVPGQRFVYTNTGFPLLGRVVEKASGMPYEQFVRERIFQVAGMTGTRFKQPPELVPRRASGYVERDGTFISGEPLRPRIIAANGGILSSATDMGRWIVALFGGTLILPSRLREMTTPIRLTDGTAFDAGMAWFIDVFRGHRLIVHNGSTIGGFSSVVHWYPDDRLGVVVLMNIDRWNAVNVLAAKVADLFVPGRSPAGLLEGPDPDPAVSRQLLRLLADVANGRDSVVLADHLRTPNGAPRVGRDFGFDGPVDRFAFLQREDLGSTVRERFGQRVRWIHRYRLVAGDRIIHYTFELDALGKVVRFFPEEG